MICRLMTLPFPYHAANRENSEADATMPCRCPQRATDDLADEFAYCC